MKILNSSIIWMILILGIGFLSSCGYGYKGESRNKADYFVSDNHQYIQFGFGQAQSIVHNPECEKKDMLSVLDSLSHISQ